ncbi:MAG TPA: DUF92 domain-containing protein [Terriglobales bacterium]|nr:DUF92 domain-containing protein [Terriglobales bacterium]
MALRTSGNLLQAAVVTLVFAVVARFVNGVTTRGALAGGLIAFAMYAGAGPGAFGALVSVFVIAIVTTRIGYSRKQKLGAAEGRAGRSASQIVANTAVAALTCILFALWRNSIFLLAGAAALAEAAADTASSEIGEAVSERARLITTFQYVAAGTDGGITVSGTFAGAIAAIAVAAWCVLVRLISGPALWLAAGAGFFGMLLDSVLGAVLERRRMLNNDAVNVLGTLSAALIALLLARMLL